jgi:hypothetical protein
MAKTRWFYDRDGHVNGPVSVSELRQLAASGELLPTDQVRKEDMDRWVKAKAVKGLFDPAAADEERVDRPSEPADGDTVFDFFGAGRPPEAESEPEPAATFNPAFDFFGVGPPTAASPPTEAETFSAVAPPGRKSSPPRKSKVMPPPVPTAPEPESPAGAGSFQITDTATSPTESRVETAAPFAEFAAEVPLAAPVGGDDEVPFADPASAIGKARPVTELSGAEVTLHPDGTATATDRILELSVTGGWLACRGGGEETYLRLSRVDAVTLRERGPAGWVLGVHSGEQTVAVHCEGDTPPVRAFLRRLLDAAG